MNEPAPDNWPASPVDGTIAVEVEYAPDEFARLAVGGWIRNWNFWFLLLCAFTVLTCVMQWENLTAGDWWHFYKVPVATLSVGAIILWVSYASAKRVQSESATLSKPLTFVFGPDRLWISGHGTRDELEYQVLYGAKETREYILLMLNSAHWYSIPKRAIPDAQALAALRQTINQGLPGNAKHRLQA